MNTPTVSVLMPVYNAERYVAEAVESVLAQTFTDFELLIIDDGSTDGSLAILQQYAARDPRIRLTSRPNTGCVIALNEMLAQAQGEFLARMDADDVCMPERFAKQIAFLMENTDHLAVGTSVLLIDSDGDPLCVFRQPAEHNEIDRTHLSGKACAMIIHPSLMVSSRALLSIGGYRTGFLPAEDFDLFLRLAEIGKLANLPDILVKYRRHAAAIGYRHYCEQMNVRDRAILEAVQRRELPEKPVLTGGYLPRTVTDQHRMWAWWALGAGHVRSARKHALTALRRNPLALESWRVAYCALRGR